MTNAELAILSLVAEKPRHGYDIEQVIEARGMRDWTEIGFSSIYYLLNKLEKTGLIESQLQQSVGRGPARKVFNITQKGWAAHLDGVVDALSNPHTSSSSLLLGLSNFPMVSRDQILDALNGYVSEIESSIDHMIDRSLAQQPLPPFVEAMFDYSQTMAEAELKWIKNFIKEVEAENV